MKVRFYLKYFFVEKVKFRIICKQTSKQLRAYRFLLVFFFLGGGLHIVFFEVFFGGFFFEGYAARK